MENPDYWRTVKDPVTGEDVVLSDEQLQLIQKIEGSEYPEQSLDPYEVHCGQWSCERLLMLA